MSTYSLAVILGLTISNTIGWILVYKLLHTKSDSKPVEEPVIVKRSLKPYAKGKKQTVKINDDDYFWRKENDLDLRSNDFSN